MFYRKITETLQRALASFAVTVLTGPRQSGKTTLLRHLLPDYTYVNLERPDILLRIKEDPMGFLNDNKMWIIDEAQNFPELFSYIQVYVDEQGKPGQFILSGSQNFLLSKHISQSLAGRAAILQLLPLLQQEYLSNPDCAALDIWPYLYQGSYPKPYQEKIDITLWYQSYIQTYLERDVRSQLNIKDLHKFQLFLKLCAGRHGQLLNLSSLAADVGVSQTTVSHWLNVLEASYLVFRLQPYYKNFNKRLVKTPKLYFYDSAIVCQLLGIDSSEHLKIHAARGAIFEGYIIAEMVKYYVAQGKPAPVYFWRDQQGLEIDCIIERGDMLTTLEVKSAATFTESALKNIKTWQKITKDVSINSLLVYTGNERLNVQSHQILPWDQITAYLS